MRPNLISVYAALLTVLMIGIPDVSMAQSEKALVKKYLNALPEIPLNKNLHQYRMTAIYTNRDLYGNFTGKTKVTGDYTSGLPGDSAVWNNVYISNSSVFDEPFTRGSKKDYMENFKYFPSADMLKEAAFKNFPSAPENIFARNLVWDMLSFDIFARDYYDSLKLNQPYTIPDISGDLDMADIGKYSHNKIILCWEGVSTINGQLCAIISFNAADNLLELDMPMIKSKGTEQYWGTILLSLESKGIERAVMYSGTIQELTITGMSDKLLMKTIRELEVEKIK